MIYKKKKKGHLEQLKSSNTIALGQAPKQMFVHVHPTDVLNLFLHATAEFLL